jgi:hypothetical protein
MVLVIFTICAVLVLMSAAEEKAPQAVRSRRARD